MHRHVGMAAGLSVSLLLLALPVSAHALQSRLQPGEALPSLSGQTLSGASIDLPADASGRPAVVLFTFSRAAGQDAQSWSRRLANDSRDAPVYTVINLESAPRLLRGMITSAIKGQMPKAALDRAVVLYRDNNLWKQRLAIADANRACVVLIGADGRIKWMNAGPFSESNFQTLRSQLRSDSR